MHVTVISPESAVFDGEAESVTIPAYDGYVGILERHAPFMTLLGSGTMTLVCQGSARTFHVHGGFVQVVSNTVRVVAETVQGGRDAA